MNTAPLPSRDEILSLLKNIPNPLKDGENIVDAGFITAPLSRNIDGEVQIGLILDIKQKNEAVLEALEKQVETKLIDETSAQKVSFLRSMQTGAAPSQGGSITSGNKHNLISNPPKGGIKPQSAHSQGHKPLGGLGSATASPALAKVKKIILVASGKGGVGKSTVSSNFAMALKAMGKKVGLLDADIYGPSMPTMFDLHEKPKVNEDNQIMPLEKYGIKLMSIGFLADTNKAMIWRGPMIQGALMQMMNDCAWGELDYLVIDLPPGTGDIQLTLAQKFDIYGAIIVSTPQILALDDVRRGIQMFTQVDVPILGIIENMAYFESEDGVKNYVFGKGGARMIAEKIAVPLLGEIPLIPAIGMQADMGKPIVEMDPDSIEASHYLNIAKEIDV